MEVEVSDDMTIKKFNVIKKSIKKNIRNIFPEIERITITAITKDSIEKNKLKENL
jgi:divalent metal cation (Fe/Co/Zn/Cd) transporter